MGFVNGSGMGETVGYPLERSSLSPPLEAAVPSEPGARRGQGSPVGSAGRALLMSDTGHQVFPAFPSLIPRMSSMSIPSPHFGH